MLVLKANLASLSLWLSGRSTSVWSPSVSRPNSLAVDVKVTITPPCIHVICMENRE